MNRIRSFIRANNFPWVTFKRYWKYSSTSELLMDVLFPCILSIILLIFTSLSVDDFKPLIEKVQQISGQVIAAVAILAGFNIASISILATITGGPTETLRKKRSDDGSLNLYEMLICFFTWAVIIQLIVVLLSIIFYYIGLFIPRKFENLKVNWFSWVFIGVWLTITIHSIFLSIRNMKTLYLYVTYKKPSSS
ncbi:MAG: hypothetical protein C6W55_15955 [Thermobacillus sp.]|uniref:hypothetical protein n=1 Tax=Thermobacillus sp. TaxID=2108467 RepID=UPI000E383AC6|nr:hypothetical protein [Thermobacillus sp.]REK52607.1 MAG: hypothetical protein C6W55_15955 [Thermobacillus sp.]